MHDTNQKITNEELELVPYTRGPRGSRCASRNAEQSINQSGIAGSGGCTNPAGKSFQNGILSTNLRSPGRSRVRKFPLLSVALTRCLSYFPLQYFTRVGRKDLPPHLLLLFTELWINSPFFLQKFVMMTTAKITLSPALTVLHLNPVPPRVKYLGYIVD